MAGRRAGERGAGPGPGLWRAGRCPGPAAGPSGAARPVPARAGARSLGRPRRPRAMRRSSTDESTYRRSPSPPGKEPGFARGGPFFGLHANPGPKAAQARYTSPKGNKYVVFYLDLSFIFLLELKRCSMARGCLQGVKYLMFAFNLLFWVSGGGAPGSLLALECGGDTRDADWGVCLGSPGARAGPAPGEGFRCRWGPPGFCALGGRPASSPLSVSS